MYKSQHLGFRTYKFQKTKITKGTLSENGSHSSQEQSEIERENDDAYSPNIPEEVVKLKNAKSHSISDTNLRFMTNILQKRNSQFSGISAITKR
jgi:hypothetical protein